MEPVVPLDYHVPPGGRLQGRFRVPGDKSVSHRALMLGAIAEGTTRIHGFLESADTRATAAAFRALGVNCETPAPAEVVIRGVGRHGLKAPAGPLDLGNSGTTARLLAGILAGQAFDSVLVGDASLMQRPMRRIAEPLRLMNADILCGDRGTLPLTIRGGRTLRAITYTLPVASAQIKSCLLLAGLYAEGETCLHEPAVSRDHTERMLGEFGYGVRKSDTTVCVRGGGRLKAAEITVPGDFSSAAFFMVGASIAPGSDITLEQVGVNPTRAAAIDLLKAMGADITLIEQRVVSGEPSAAIRVRSARLRGIEIPVASVPAAIDEFPALMIAAAAAEGRTVLRGAAELRVKESDRIAAIAAGLKAVGISVTEHEDGLVVEGGRIRGGQVDSRGDHRIAMAFAMAGLTSEAPVRISDCTNVDTSFPGFVELARQAGLAITAEVQTVA